MEKLTATMASSLFSRLVCSVTTFATSSLLQQNKKVSEMSEAHEKQLHGYGREAPNLEYVKKLGFVWECSQNHSQETAFENNSWLF